MARAQFLGIAQMDQQTMINLAIGCAIGVVGWLARELWGAVQKLRDDLQALEVDLPRTYVAKTDWISAWEQVNRKLDKISDKIDGKADK